jgi:cytochrome c biogenesis protein CcdA
MENAEHIIISNPWLGFGVVFIGGLLTASNPCVLAMIPLMIGFVGGQKELVGFRKSFIFSILFVIGLSVTFGIMGVIAATTGSLLGDVGNFWRYIVAAVCIVMGIHLLEIIRIPIPSVQMKNVKFSGTIGAFLMGLLFGVVSTPCAVPILAVILVLIAAKGSMLYGLGLLFSYSIGHCVLIVIAGTSIGTVKKLLDSKHFNRANLIFRKVAAVFIIIVGIYFLFRG